MRYKFRQQQSQQGVALMVALFVLAIMSTILIAVLVDVQGEMKMSGINRNSERALKIAEAGVNIARASFQQEGMYTNLTSTAELASVDGFFQGGYFFVHMGSGFPGNEKWVQWHYNACITGNNNQSEVTTPLRRVWATGGQGRNGDWRGGSSFYVNNIYAIVAGGAYFPIEAGTNTTIRAHDEYTGKQEIVNKGYDNGETPYWVGDKSIGNSTNAGYVVRMSPMASYSNLSTIWDLDEIAITQQTLYFTYVGAALGEATTTTDYRSTVRLRAANAIGNPATQTELSTLWEFDTGLHGVGTAPAFFDPTPDQPGDEIIYFAVVAFTKKTADGSQFTLNLRGDFKEYPRRLQDGDEQIYLFAVVDTSRLGLGNPPYILKWARPFPDPDVIDWTDYPTEQATGTTGYYPPYVSTPSDMTPFLPEDDVLFDYRDGTVNVDTDDNQRNQVRGNPYMVFDPQSVSPPILSVSYQLDDGTISTDRKDTLPEDETDPLSPMRGDPADPLVDIYLAFAAHSRATGTDVMSSTNYNSINWNNGILGNKKKSRVQARVIALRDRLDGSCDNQGKNCSFDWNSAKSRFPIYKWSYRLPAWDPKSDDARPWNGYGEFTWETWFEQQVAPMLNSVKVAQDETEWTTIPNLAGGRQNRYTVVYPSYESLGFVSGSANHNDQPRPTTTQGAPVAFTNGNSTDQYDYYWDTSKLMVMGIRDTWDDYMKGYQTNELFGNMTGIRNTQIAAQGYPFTTPVKSNPVEPYWKHQHDDVICADADTSDGFNEGEDIHQTYPDSAESLITFPQYPANADKVGFERPYIWSEGMFQTQIKGTSHPNRNLDAQGWKGVGASLTGTDSDDLDVEGETSAFCSECLNGDGLIVTVFNHDLDTSREDLRVHAVNARTGVHVWDFHMPAKLAGDYFNATPGIANNMVFVAYQRHSGRQSILQVMDADNGDGVQRITFDDDSDVVLIPPTIANGAVYVGSYDFNGDTGDSNMDNDIIRIFAFSPMLRMFATGIYPMSTTLSETKYSLMPRSERKLQVWISGTESKWQEVGEIYQ